MTPNIVPHALVLSTFALCASAQSPLAERFDWTRDPVGQRWYAEAPVAAPWTDSADWARTLGAELATVRSLQEQAWLESHYFAAPPLRPFHWLGLFQDPTAPGFSEPSGGWTWLSGDPLVFTNWASGAPDNATPDERFARTRGAFDANQPGAWEDADDVEFAAPNGLLDWCIPSGQYVTFNTANSTITLGLLSVFVANPSFPNDPQFPPSALFAPTNVVSVQGGVVEVRDFYLAPGAVLRVEGPNAFQLVAHGDVWIRGQILLDGASAPPAPPVYGTFRAPGDVVVGSTPSNAYAPFALGGPGRAGGGDGGANQPATVSDLLRGGAGAGAFGAPSRGGEGGESGWGAQNADQRRAAGGGGGRFGPDVRRTDVALAGQLDQRRIGLDAERGFDGPTNGNGAISSPGKPLGGSLGATPFETTADADDFFGLARDEFTGEFVLGELARPWAGAGGGAGGCAFYVATWPPPIGSFLYDWLGGGGGGGGGSCRIRATGSILFGSLGRVRANGGHGSGGSPGLFFDRYAGGGGGGSGGHLILETAERIDLRASPVVNFTSPTDDNFALSARGGQGGAGRSNLGGSLFSANGVSESLPSADACPPGHPMNGDNACRGPIVSAGGDGGPGVVQLHTPLGRAGANPSVDDILLPIGASLDRICVPSPWAPSSSGSLRAISSAGAGFGLFELESDDCDLDGEPDRFTIAIDAQRDLDRDGVLDECQDFVRYCVAGLSSNGCVATLGWSGSPSVSASSGFQLTATGLDGRRTACVFVGLGVASTPFAPASTSFLCVAPPLRLIGARSTAGSLGACNGTTAVDWNAWRATHPNAFGGALVAGARVNAQTWTRDLAAPGGATLSDALRFTLAP